MFRLINTTFRVALTLIVVACAIIAAWIVYANFLAHPWTRDGQVRALIVKVAPRVSGPIVKVNVIDNQAVKRGELLFIIDPEPFELAVEKAKAVLAQAQARENELKLEAERREAIPGAVTVETITKAQAKYREAIADVGLAKAELDLANLSLSYTRVYAKVPGYVTNLLIDIGTYVTAKQPILALVDSDSYWVSGYFKETMLSRINIGDKANVTLMGYRGDVIKGEVQSIGWGISRTDTEISSYLLPKVKATFDWVRLAQRIPVRIKLLKVPKNVRLIVGETASVEIISK